MSNIVIIGGSGHVGTYLVPQLVAQGQLVEVGGHALRTGLAFHVVWPRSRELSGAATRVRNWLLDQA